MTEGITIALITAIGSLLGGILAQSIAAYATIKAATLKQGENQSASQAAGSNKNSQLLPGFWIGTLITAIVIIAFFKITGYIPPISFGEKFVTKLIIPSNNNQGFTYNIPNDGVYTFRYSDSAVSGWQPLDSPNTERWHATVSCFRGSAVIWDNGGVDSNFSLFEIGTGKSYKTRGEAIRSSSGENATAGFRAGEQITCVIADGQYDFGDNSGEVVLDLFVSP
jgi:hypothetical protein